MNIQEYKNIFYIKNDVLQQMYYAYRRYARLIIQSSIFFLEKSIRL